MRLLKFDLFFVRLCSGLKLQGANWTGSHLDLNDGSTVDLDKSSLIWTPKEALNHGQDGSTQTSSKADVRVPLSVYLNADRSVSLFTIHLPAVEGLKASMVAKRAVALRAS